MKPWIQCTSPPQSNTVVGASPFPKWPNLGKSSHFNKAQAKLRGRSGSSRALHPKEHLWRDQKKKWELTLMLT